MVKASKKVCFACLFVSYMTSCFFSLLRKKRAGMQKRLTPSKRTTFSYDFKCIICHHHRGRLSTKPAIPQRGKNVTLMTMMMNQATVPYHFRQIPQRETMTPHNAVQISWRRWCLGEQRFRNARSNSPFTWTMVLAKVARNMTTKCQPRRKKVALL